MTDGEYYGTVTKNKKKTYLFITIIVNIIVGRTYGGTRIIATTTISLIEPPGKGGRLSSMPPSPH